MALWQRTKAKWSGLWDWTWNGKKGVSGLVWSWFSKFGSRYYLPYGMEMLNDHCLSSVVYDADAVRCARQHPLLSEMVLIDHSPLGLYAPKIPSDFLIQ